MMMIKSLSAILLLAVGVTLLVSFRHGLGLFKRLPRSVKLLGVMWWLLAIGSGVYFTRTGTVHGMGRLDRSAMMQLVFFVISGLIVLRMLALTRGGHIVFRFPVLALCLYSLTGLLSTLYSPAPFISFYKAWVVLIDVLAIAATVPLLRQVNKPALVFDIAVGSAIVFSVGAFIGVHIRPEAAIRPIHSGGFWGFILDGAFPYMNGNELGFLSAVVLLVALSRLFQPEYRGPKFFWVVCGAVGASGMIFAQARTAIVGLFVGVCVLSFGVRRLRIFAITGMVIASMAGLIMLASGSSFTFGNTAKLYLSKGQADQGLQSLEGRARTWLKVGLPMFEDSPVLGHGFDVGVRFGGEEFGIENTHMHNSHVQILANSGLVGYLPWLAMVLWVFVKFSGRIFGAMFRRGVKLSSEEYVMYAVLIMLVLRTITGSVMVNHSTTILLLVGMITYYYSFVASSRSADSA